jgi:hypothetical protein
MKAKLLGNLVRRLKARITKQSKVAQGLLVTEQTIDRVLATESGDAEELEEFLDSVLTERVEGIQELNESLRGKN